MPDNPFLKRVSSGRWRLTPQARSTTRLALVACSLVATVGVLLVITLQARRAEEAQDNAASQTLRDYTGYASRMMGAEILRVFGDQRATILAPVTGSSGRAVPAPRLSDVARLGDTYFAALGIVRDSGIGYFRVDAVTGATEVQGNIPGALAGDIADTVRKVVADGPWDTRRNILSLRHGDVAYSVAIGPLFDEAGRTSAIFGYTYTRARGVSAVAERVFRTTPLLPTSYTGERWNYDTTWARTSGMGNEAFLGVRVTDRAGFVLWESANARELDTSPFRERVVLSTANGGLVIETAIRASSERSLIPTIVRNAQRWSTRALLALTVLLLLVSLMALQGERLGARARREEAMQQLALGLRHEINNALASVLLNAELLGEEESLDESQRERLEAIVEQADRMRGVLRKLERIEGLDVVPYLNEGYMVDLSAEGAADEFKKTR